MLVLAGRSIWGKTVNVAAHIATVRRTTDAGYRDVVQLASWHDDRLRLGPRGVLEGTGEAEARVRLVPTTESVSVGDVLLATGSEGLLESRLTYGQVTWMLAESESLEIWMRPTADFAAEHVVVLTVQLNSQRLADDAPCRRPTVSERV